jgi:ABC-type anion transport system duplicated permease subunit
MTPHFVSLLTNPGNTWEKLRQKEDANSLHYLRHLLLMALVPPVCLFFGITLTGWSIFGDESLKLTTGGALLLSVMLYIAIMIAELAMGAFVHWMCRSFQVRPSFNRCVGFMSYVTTPYFVAGVFALYPSRWVALAVFVMASLHASYLLFTGLPKYMRVPEERGFNFAAAVWGAGVVILVAVLTAVILQWKTEVDPLQNPQAGQAEATQTIRDQQ